MIREKMQCLVVKHFRHITEYLATGNFVSADKDKDELVDNIISLILAEVPKERELIKEYALENYGYNLCRTELLSKLEGI